jgi:hypothetical protein
MNMLLRKKILGAVLLVVGAVSLCAGEPANNATVQSTNLPLKEIAPGVFQLGSVQLNKEKKTIQFPAMVNMTNGPVEYFVVTGTGKLHESVLKTEAEPSQIHIAMLFIGAQGATTNTAATNISGDKFSIEVSWKNGDLNKRVSGEDLIFNAETKSSMSKGYWIYNGSKVIDGTFIAQRDGSIVSIIRDALALANNPRPGSDNDEIWSVNTNLVPPLNTSVDVMFKLEWPQKNAKDAKK